MCRIGGYLKTINTKRNVQHTYKIEQLQIDWFLWYVNPSRIILYLEVKETCT